VTAVLVALGAAVGGIVRYVVTLRLDGRRPAGTLAVNVAGSGVVGLAAALALDGRTWALVATGLCGALTTFSGFAVQAVDSAPRERASYVVATVVGSVGLCAVGWWLGTTFA
jgi:fluoride exporter